MARYAFYIDTDRCTGCKTCQVACKETYGLPTDVLWRRVFNYQGGTWQLDEASGVYTPQNIYAYFVSMACNHCGAPACLAVCPTSAIIKDTESGIVTIDEELCIGCGSCETACPYSVPQLEEEAGVYSKCDMCSALVAEGDIPVCVSGCVMRALDFGDMDDLIAKYGEGNVEIAPLPADSTGPSLVLNPHRQAKPTGDTTGSEVSLAEEV